MNPPQVYMYTCMARLHTQKAGEESSRVSQLWALLTTWAG